MSRSFRGEKILILLVFHLYFVMVGIKIKKNGFCCYKASLLFLKCYVKDVVVTFDILLSSAYYACKFKKILDFTRENRYLIFT